MSQQEQNSPISMADLKLGLQALLDAADGLDANDKYYVKAQPIIASGGISLEEYKTFLRKFIQAVGCFKEELMTICPLAFGIINPTIEEYRKKDVAIAEKVSENYKTKLSLREGLTNGQVQKATQAQTQAVKEDTKAHQKAGIVKP